MPRPRPRATGEPRRRADADPETAPRDMIDDFSVDQLLALLFVAFPWVMRALRALGRATGSGAKSQDAPHAPNAQAAHEQGPVDELGEPPQALPEQRPVDLQMDPPIAPSTNLFEQAPAAGDTWSAPAYEPYNPPAPPPPEAALAPEPVHPPVQPPRRRLMAQLRGSLRNPNALGEAVALTAALSRKRRFD